MLYLPATIYTKASNSLLSTSLIDSSDSHRSEEDSRRAGTSFSTHMAQHPMNCAELRTAYLSGTKTPADVVETVYERISAADTNAWIAIRKKEAVKADAAALDDPTDQPLYGIPFAVKDNIDYAGLPTTAGCPAYAYEPETNATVVEKLVDAGALLIGKTNMDQFATGLVGTRSPYGACRNVHNDAYISGGSSAGSAVATARGHVAFALGTDTAGSGRVPAAFNGLIGLKPTRGSVSNTGVVPACASLDCVSVFAQTCEDALAVQRVITGFDASDPYSREEADDSNPELTAVSNPTIGIPKPADREFFGDSEAAQLFENTCCQLETFATVVPVETAPFYQTAELLYGGPWVAERFAAVGEFMLENPGAAHPIVEEIIKGGKSYSAVETFEAFYELERLRRRAKAVMADIDALVVPTAGTTYTIEAVRESPFELNSNLGYYTNFVNLLDLSAVSVPVGAFEAGPTFGVTVICPAFADGAVTSIGKELTEST